MAKGKSKKANMTAGMTNGKYWHGYPIEAVKVDDLIPYENNPRKNENAVPAVVASIKAVGFINPIVLDKDGVIINGHTRRLAAMELGMTEVPCIRPADLTPEQVKLLRIADNKVSELAEWDFEKLGSEFGDLKGEFNLGDFGFKPLQVFGLSSQSLGTKGESGALTQKFGAPPFSVFDGRAGEWQRRKRQWRELINDNGESRKNLLGGLMGVSVLDPALAEIINMWFCPQGGTSFDTFAGDTVFGFVSAYLGNTFTGIELREEQARLNNLRVKGMSAHYINDDGQNVRKHFKPQSQDMFFSCPPYFDLEVYSDKPNDASNQETYEDFLAILRTAFHGAVECLKDNRFAVVVCSDLRDKQGNYRCFPADIVRIFAEAGMPLYNDIILLDPIGSAAFRASGIFTKSRKCVRVHQNVLVFFKGDPKTIKDNYKEVQFERTDLERFGVDSDNATEETQEDF